MRIIVFFASMFVPFTVAFSQTKTPPHAEYSRSSSAHTRGQFHGDLILKEIGAGQIMEVQSRFAYTDWHGNTLVAPAGFKSDGATIPRAVWSLVGGPWDGPYRRGAVVHDVGCETHELTWQQTHRLFYEAMLDGGTGRKLALVMYWGVLVGGPRWEKVAMVSAPTREAAVAKANAELAFQSISLDSATVEVNPFYEPGMSASLNGGGAPRTLLGYKATAFAVTGTRDINPKELTNLSKELEARDVANKPVTPEEIERRAQEVDENWTPRQLDQLYRQQQRWNPKP